jgi:hypothetical protein
MNNDCTASMASSIARRAAVFNNEGTALLQAGRCRDAVQAFTAVLGTLKPFIPGGTSAGGDSNVGCVTATVSQPAVVAMGATSGDNDDGRSHGNSTSPNNRYDQSNTTATAQRECDNKFIQSSAASASTTTAADTTSSGTKRKRSHSNSFSLPSQYSAAMTAAAAAAASDIDGVDSDGPGYFVFQDPIEIPLDVIPRRSAPSKKLITKFVVVTMYNLALAVHLSAEAEAENCDMSSDDDDYDDDRDERRLVELARAQRLYELAFQMHLEESCDVTLLYSLALMNNLGLIYRIMGDVDRSQRCFQNQLSTMMYLLEAQEARTIKQWDGLFSNVMNFVLKSGHGISAPAA